MDTGRPNRTTWHFGATALVAMLALAVVVVWVGLRTLQDQTERVATASAVDVSTVVAARFEVTGLAPATDVPVRTPDGAVRTVGSWLVGVQVWDTTGRQVFTARALPATTPDDGRLATVLETGRPDAVTVRVAGRPVVDVYVPLRARQFAGGSGANVVAVAHVLVDNTQGEQDTIGALLRISGVLVAGLTVVWFVLDRSVRTTQRRLQAVAQENARLAYLDSLTGLPNRRMFADRMGEVIDQAEQDGSRVGLIMLDLDRFKEINDTLGHDRGDVLLEQAAGRLRSALGAEDTVARLGGDEFAVLLPGVESVEEAVHQARRLRTLFDSPFDLGELTLHVEPSLGVACLPEHASDASGLMRMADVAMYRAKANRTGVAVYSTQTDQSSTERLRLAGDLHRALRSREPGELVLYYQPKVDLTTGRLVGLEALIRWEHPTHGLLAPGAFVALAEQSGLIHDLTRFALGQAVAQLAAWREDSWAVPVAVNLSGHDLVDDTVVDVIADLLAYFEVPAELLMVEITETALVVEPARILPVLSRLSGLGVRVAIDDFGIGSTSISQLRNLPVDQLKIDQLFIRDLSEPDRESPEVLVAAMADLAHSFGLEVVAEGVEDEGTAALVAMLGADQAQGYFYARPQPPDVVRDGYRADPAG